MTFSECLNIYLQNTKHTHTQTFFGVQGNSKIRKNEIEMLKMILSQLEYLGEGPVPAVGSIRSVHSGYSVVKLSPENN